jgi:hypothetical protein
MLRQHVAVLSRRRSSILSSRKSCLDFPHRVVGVHPQRRPVAAKQINQVHRQEMKPTLHFFCEKCEESVHLRADADSIPPCPHCRRDSLVLVNTPNGAPVTAETAAAAFAAMRRAVEETPHAK